MELNYQEIVNLLQYQANKLIQENAEFNDLNCFFVNEQAFNKQKLKTNDILVVVRFGAASVFQKKIDLGVYFDIVSLPNDIAKTQAFFTAYALAFNENMETNIFQFYNTPSVISRFNDYGYETRATLSMYCAFVITLNGGILDIQIFDETKQEYESIRFLNEQIRSDFAPLPEPTGDSNGRNITTNQANTITLSFSTYFNGSAFVDNCLVYAFDSSKDFNKRFKIRVNLADAYILDESFVITAAYIERDLASTSILRVVLAV